jgi:hypothetical protein
MLEDTDLDVMRNICSGPYTVVEGVAVYSEEEDYIGINLDDGDDLILELKKVRGTPP